MSDDRRSPRILLAADAFLLAGTLDLLLTAAFALVIALADVNMENAASSLGAVWGSVISVSASVVLLTGGAVAAWLLHRRTFDLASTLSLLAGAVGGLAVSMSLLVSGARLFRMLRLGPRQGPPWAGIIFLALLTVAFLAIPLIDAVRDLRARRRHVLLDWLRLVGLAVLAALALVVLPWLGAAQGSEMGEAAVFMVPFAAAAAIGVALADFVQLRLHRDK